MNRRGCASTKAVIASTAQPAAQSARHMRDSDSEIPKKLKEVQSAPQNIRPKQSTSKDAAGARFLLQTEEHAFSIRADTCG